MFSNELNHSVPSVSLSGGKGGRLPLWCKLPRRLEGVCGLICSGQTSSPSPMLRRGERASSSLTEAGPCRVRPAGQGKQHLDDEFCFEPRLSTVYFVQVYQVAALNMLRIPACKCSGHMTQDTVQALARNAALLRSLGL